MVVPAHYRVIYGDTDQMGVVYYGNYLRFFEIGRNEYLRAQGSTYRLVEERGIFLPVVKASCVYRKPARYDDLLTIETRIPRIKGARVLFAYEIKDGEGNLLVEGETEHACVDASGRVVRMPGDLVEILGPEEG